MRHAVGDGVLSGCQCLKRILHQALMADVGEESTFGPRHRVFRGTDRDTARSFETLSGDRRILKPTRGAPPRVLGLLGERVCSGAGANGKVGKESGTMVSFLSGNPMPKYSLNELRAVHRDPDFRDAFAHVTAIHTLFTRGLLSQSFVPTAELSGAISLTTAGEWAEDNTDLRDGGLSPEEKRFVTFLLFGHDELFVDPVKTDKDILASGLDVAIRSGGLSFPWVFDNILYRKAFDLFPKHPDKLNIGQTRALLADTPQGVFQVGNVIAGPLGALESVQRRRFTPTSRLPLWHCADPMCNAIHGSTLAAENQRLLDACRRVRRALMTKGDRTRWEEFGLRLCESGDYYDSLTMASLPWFMGNALSLKEVRLLLARVIEQDKTIRQYLPTMEGSGTDIAEKLEKNAAVQSVLTASDECIVAALDDLISTGSITIPALEIRSSRPSPGSRSWMGSVCEASSLGFRSGNRGGDVPLARLRSLLLELFGGDPDQLKWILRGRPGPTFAAKLEAYVNAMDPEEMLRETAFSSGERLEKAFVFLRCKHLQLPGDFHQDNLLIQRLLWKLGFKRTKFDSPSSKLKCQLSELTKIALTREGAQGAWQSDVRGIGVNLFVSIEEMLEATLSFATWMLLSDHPSHNHTYRPDTGRAFMAAKLSGVLSTSEGQILLDPKGKNTLFPLASGFLALSKLIRGILGESAQYLKPKVLLAHYCNRTTLQIYPYRHIYFVADAEPQEARAAVDILESAGKTFQDQHVLSVRNRLPHKAEEFPSPSEIKRCCEAIETEVAKLEAFGLMPTIHVPRHFMNDIYGRGQVTFVDPAENETNLRPSPALGSIKSLPGLDEPQIIVRGMHVAGTGEMARFRIAETSEYRALWANYPLRSQPSAADTAEAEDFSCSVTSFDDTEA